MLSDKQYLKYYEKSNNLPTLVGTDSEVEFARFLRKDYLKSWEYSHDDFRRIYVEDKEFCKKHADWLDFIQANILVLREKWCSETNAKVFIELQTSTIPTLVAKLMNEQENGLLQVNKCNEYISMKDLISMCKTKSVKNYFNKKGVK